MFGYFSSVSKFQNCPWALAFSWMSACSVNISSSTPDEFRWNSVAILEQKNPPKSVFFFSFLFFKSMRSTHTTFAIDRSIAIDVLGTPALHHPAASYLPFGGCCYPSLRYYNLFQDSEAHAFSEEHGRPRVGIKPTTLWRCCGPTWAGGPCRQPPWPADFPECSSAWPETGSRWGPAASPCRRYGNTGSKQAQWMCVCVCVCVHACVCTCIRVFVCVSAWVRACVCFSSQDEILVVGGTFLSDNWSTE